MHESRSAPARIVPTGAFESEHELRSLFAPGAYRWAIYDRLERTLWFGPGAVHTHMGVADEAGVLRHPPAYYRPGGNVLGGFLCRSLDGDFYFDPFSGTFPGTDMGVQEAEEALAEAARGRGLAFIRYDEVPESRRAAGRSGAGRM